MLFTFGGPHGGVSEYKDGHSWYSPVIKHTLSFLASTSVVQNFGAPIDYLRQNWDEEKYLSRKDRFLPRINNEYETKEEIYKTRLSAIKTFGLWMWTEDEMIVPRESAWFSIWDKDQKLIALKDQKMFTDDYIGLK